MANIVLAAGQGLKMNAGGTEQEAYTPSSGGSKSAFLASLASNQSTNLTTSDHIAFETTTFSTGSSITMATGAGQANGIFTLAANKTYLLRSVAQVRYTNSTDRLDFVWRRTSGTPTSFGLVSFGIPTTYAGQSEVANTEAIYAVTTGGTAETWVVQINAATGSPVRIEGSPRTWAYIQEI